MQGILLHTEGRFDEAVEALRGPRHWQRARRFDRGNSLLDLGRMNQALRAHETAVERDPSHPGARYNLALTQLRLGDWEHGWPNYEARWRFREVHRRREAFLSRDGRRTLDGRRVLLHAEQDLATPFSSAVTQRWWRRARRVPVLRFSLRPSR